MHDDPLYDDDLLDHDLPPTDDGPYSRADQWVDDLMPDGFNWRLVVTNYPRSALLASLIGGVVIGRTHGVGLLTGLSGFFIGEITRNLKDVVDDLTSS